MNMFSLRTIIDDILLIVRNNNISESEDLSRALIAAWIMAYRAQIIKQRRDLEKLNSDTDDDDTTLEALFETKGPLELEQVTSLDETPLFRRKTINKIPTLFDDDECNLISVHDLEGCVILKMDKLRSHYHRFRKYTGPELTYYYENGYVYINGIEDYGKLKYIWITGLFSGDDASEDDADEDDIKIPGWMIPDIKKMIMQNELSFMLQRISDDDNNSTLDGIKPLALAVTPNEK